MKGILKFNLDDPEDDMAMKRCHKSLAMALVLFELSRNTRKKIEYNPSFENADNYSVADMYSKEIYRLLDEHNIIIDELIS